MSRNFELLRKSNGSEALKPISIEVENGVPAPAFVGAPDPTEGREWFRALRALQRHWRWSLGFAAAVTLSVAAIVFLIRPVYEPTARIQTDPPGNELFSLDAHAPLDSTAYAETQAKALESDQLAIAVIRKLGLVHNRDFVTPKFLAEHPAMTAAAGDGTLAMTPAEQKALRVFRRSLTVQRDPASWIISVSFAAHDPVLAANITNEIVAEFIELSYQTRHDAILESTRWLSRQLDDIRARMDESNRALADFQKSSGITPVGNNQSTFDEKMLELNRQVTMAEADRIQLEALLHKVNAAAPDTLPQVKADPVVQDISKQLATAQAALQQDLVVYGPNHPKTKQLQAQVKELEQQLQGQQRSILSNLRTSYAAANTREQLLNSQLKDATKQLGQFAQYQALQKEAQANETLYNTLYTRVKEAGIAAESKSSNVRWVDHPRVLDRPTRPQRVLDIALAMLAGIIGGIMLAFVREGMDTKIHSLDEVQSLTGLASVALVPTISSGTGQLARVPSVVMLDRPGSAEAEAVRGLLNSIRLSRASRPPQMLLIASSMGSEGKTTIATNLSVALARQGPTLIVDADLRKPRVAAIFGCQPQYGLADVLNGKCALEQALAPVPGIPNLALLGSGASDENPGELICSDFMRELMGRLRQHFQYIVVDSPPILPYADARAIAPLVDGVILVGRSAVTTRQAIKRSLELLQQSRSAPVVEVVLNGVDFNSVEYRYGYGQAYQAYT